MNIYLRVSSFVQKLLTVLLVIFTVGGFAQEKPDVSAPETAAERKFEKNQRRKLYSPAQFVHESSLFIKQPTKWKAKNWLRVGGVFAATLMVMPFDQQITTSAQGQQRYYNSLPIEGGRIYGEWYSIGGVAGAVGIFGLITQDTTAKKIAIELFQAGIYAELMTVALKVVIGRGRPETTDDPFIFNPFNLAYGYQSMPSGHTTSAFALSTVLSRHAHSTTLKILAYLPAAFTMFSRIYQNHHWLSDEILAAGIGYFVANWVVDLHDGKRHRINVTSLLPVGISYAFK